MKWMLNKDIALRGWQLVPYAYYKKGSLFAKKLTPEQYLMLSFCDGKKDLEFSTTLAELIGNNFIHRAEEGEKLSSWQKSRYCDNRYFPMANWSLTGHCNYNCKHCFMAADNKQPKYSFSRDEWMSLIDQFDECGIQSLTLTGGEPMLHPDFMDIMREIYSRGMEVFHLNTNGSLITEDVLDEFEKIGAHPLIKISFDCIGHHDWMRGVKGAEKQAMDAIDLCTRRGFRVRIQTCIHKNNIDTLLETAILMAQKGVEEMRIIRTSEAPRWVENAKDACLSWEEYYDRTLEFTEKFAETDLYMDIDIWQFLQFFPRFRCYHYRPVEGGVHCFRGSAPVCRGNRGMVAINSDGSIVPCNQMSGTFEHLNISMGNVKETPLKELLSKGTYLDAVTFTLDQLYEKNEKCNECEFKKLCAGGCRALALALNGDYYGYDPAKCLYFKKGYMNKTDKVFERVKEKSGISYRNTDDI